MRNELPAGRRFVALHLEGDGAGTNRDAVGAWVEVPTSSGTLRRSVRAGEGFLSQSSRWLHFGLGDSEVSGPVRVSWPGGGSETFAGVTAGGRYRIVQGSGRAEPAPARPRPAALEPREQQVPAPTTGSRVVLAPRPPAPSLTLRLFDASEPVPVEAGQGRPVLVNIWASWCVPCRFELQDLADEADALRAAGLEIAALSTDGMGDVATTTEDAARKFMDEIGFPFRHGMATEETLDKVEIVKRSLFDRRFPLSLPFSMLIDGEGRVAALYRGGVTAADLLADLELLDARDADLRAASAPLSGRWFTEPPGEVSLASYARWYEEPFPEESVALLRRSVDVERARLDDNGAASFERRGGAGPPVQVAPAPDAARRPARGR